MSFSCSADQLFGLVSLCGSNLLPPRHGTGMTVFCDRLVEDMCISFYFEFDACSDTQSSQTVKAAAKLVVFRLMFDVLQDDISCTMTPDGMIRVLTHRCKMCAHVLSSFAG